MNNWQIPYKFPNGMEVRNRLIFAPISTMTSTDIGLLTDSEMAFYKSRAKNVGMVVLGSAYISQAGKAYNQNVGIAHDAVIPNLKKYNQQLHQAGAKSIIQLYHGGLAVQYMAAKKEVQVVSKLPALETSDTKNNVELTDVAIQKIIEDFGKAIERAIRAGFDGIEIHAGNPFLLQQFLSPRTNQRTDFWGGDLSKRMRCLEVILRLADKIRKKVEKPFIIGVRLALEEKEAGGLSFQDTCQIAGRLSKLNIDYLHFNQHDLFEEINGQFKLDVIAESLESSVPIIGNGGIKNESQLEAACNVAPLASVARPFILQPNFPFETEYSMTQLSKTVPKGLWRSIQSSLEWYEGE
ncbi:hypothetical protein [Jeotgalibaca caeni]|uniref:oxidoreductase n=1 Tax=Jeotgalibaca caeni TaxID=3028623 RepID=UPI00237E9952|nr:hypothetical protein [Jeotgalibaca caeni]MDE1548745.1 hypothetical protein [Jeotgalibaca caeni]